MSGLKFFSLLRSLWANATLDQQHWRIDAEGGKWVSSQVDWEISYMEGIFHLFIAISVRWVLDVGGLISDLLR